MTFSIAAKKREAKNADALRATGVIPAVVYGPEIESQSIAISYRDFEKLYNEAGESSLIECSIEGEKPLTVLIQDVQYEPVKGSFRHVDFRQVNMTEEMYTTIELVFVGEAPAVKALGGTLNAGLDYVNVKCLPKDLVSQIQVDISKLASFDDAIHVKDLAVPAGITITDDPEMLIAAVNASLTEEQIKAMEEQGPQSIEDVEVVEKKKEEESAEGEEKAE